MGKLWKVQILLGIMWTGLSVMWAVLMMTRLLSGDTGDEWRFNLIAMLVCSGLSTQAFNQSVILTKLDGLR